MARTGNPFHPLPFILSRGGTQSITLSTQYNADAHGLTARSGRLLETHSKMQPLLYVFRFDISVTDIFILRQNDRIRLLNK